MEGSDLPPLYAAWVDGLLQAPIPKETVATCASCPMLPVDGAPPGAQFFQPRTKCCTYLPDLPNFLVGRILGEDGPGRAGVEARIDRGREVTPLGLHRTRLHVMMYQATTEGFGRSEALVCPHLHDGGCGVWRHRNATCATWYCKHVRGAVGQRFWRALHRLLTAVERTLSTWCVLELDPGREALERLFPTHRGTAGEPPLAAHELDGAPDPDRPALWGRFFGDERAFYRACAEKVDGLAWPDVVALSGPEVHAAAHLLRLAHQELTSEGLPEMVRLGPFRVESSDADTMRIVSYSPYDPLEIPRALADILHRFDGRPVRDVQETLLAGENLDIDDALVRKLLDFEILR